jgi:hypothetical protein
MFLCNLESYAQLGKNRDSSVGKATGWTAGVRFPLRVRDVLFSKGSRSALWSTQPPILWLGVVKRNRHEANHSPPFNAEVKNGGVMSPLPIRLLGIVLN